MKYWDVICISNWFIAICFALCLLLSVKEVPAYNEGKNGEYDSEQSIEIYVPEDSVFTDDADVGYYAYMDLETADESLKAKILEARNIIISNSSWTADGVKGYIENREDGTVRELPHFSEIFPSDWEMPVLSTKEDEQRE